MNFDEMLPKTIKMSLLYIDYEMILQYRHLRIIILVISPKFAKFVGKLPLSNFHFSGNYSVRMPLAFCPSLISWLGDGWTHP